MEDMNGIENVNEDNNGTNTNLNDLFIGDSSDSEDSKNNNNIRFSSSDSDEKITNRNKSKTIRKIETNKKSVGISATNGIKLIDNISNKNVNESSDSENSPKSNSTNSSDTKPPSDGGEHKNVTSMVEHMFRYF